MEFIPPSVVAINRHRRGAGTMSKDDLKKGDSDFTTLCKDPMEGDCGPNINILELFKQAALINIDECSEVGLGLLQHPRWSAF